MDPRIDLTDNRDFASSNNIKSIINSLDFILNEDYPIHRILAKEYDTISKLQDSKYKKIIINESTGKLEISSYYYNNSDKYYCDRCGIKILNYGLCEHCDLDLYHQSILKEFNNTINLQSIL